MKPVRILWFTLVLALCGVAPSFAGDLPAGAVDDLKTGMKKNLHGLGAYEKFVAALESSGYLGAHSPDALVAELKSEIDEKEYFQGYKMLGLALYDKGYADEAAACSEVFRKHAITIGEAIGRIDRTLNGPEASKLPDEKKDAARAQLEELKKADDARRASDEAATEY